MTQWRWNLLLDAEPHPGALNMAIDAALLAEADRTGASLLRLYRWNPPCLSLGRNEPALARYDRGAIKRRGLAVVRRPTGGRAVWHEHEVTYAVAAPTLPFGSLRESYRAIHQRLARALQALGARVELATGRAVPLRTPGACFAQPAGGEVLVGGRKVIGSAQVRQGGALLQHGSILLAGSQEMVQAVSRQPSGVNGATTLSAALGRPVPFAEVVQAIVETWGNPLTPFAPALSRVAPSRFSDPSWTWRR